MTRRVTGVKVAIKTAPHVGRKGDADSRGLGFGAGEQLGRKLDIYPHHLTPRGSDWTATGTLGGSYLAAHFAASRTEMLHDSKPSKSNAADSIEPMTRLCPIFVNVA